MLILLRVLAHVRRTQGADRAEAKGEIRGSYREQLARAGKTDTREARRVRSKDALRLYALPELPWYGLRGRHDARVLSRILCGGSPGFCAQPEQFVVSEVDQA